MNKICKHINSIKKAKLQYLINIKRKQKYVLLKNIMQVKINGKGNVGRLQVNGRGAPDFPSLAGATHKEEHDGLYLHKFTLSTSDCTVLGDQQITRNRHQENIK